MFYTQKGRRRGRHAEGALSVQVQAAPARTRPMPPVRPPVRYAQFNQSPTQPWPAPPRHARPGPPDIRWSAVREPVLLTARASSFRFPLDCFSCGAQHRNANADGFTDLYASAEAAGWRQDMYGREWRCPRCERRHEAVFGVTPVAAIEPTAGVA
jgi:hypothetical protein